MTDMQAEKVTYHEFADNLDSSESFEGPEKTLRIFYQKPSKLSDSMFAKTPGSNAIINTSPGLLEIPRSEWEEMLDLVQCKVLSVLVHPNVHAYLLSESSLFVYQDQIVLKTCGTTTLLEGLPAIMDIVQRFRDLIGLNPNVTSAIYSRRSFFNPEKQPHPHGCWDDEVSRLRKTFPSPTFACNLGADRDERWHLFTFAPQHPSLTAPPPDVLGEDLNVVEQGWVEIMMTNIDTTLAGRFHCDDIKHSLARELSPHPQSLEDSVLSMDSLASTVGADPDDDDPGHMLGNVMTHSTRIDELFNTDRQCVDSFAFNPCGYSCNGVMLESGKYFTIHVTPQSGFSYASFETNALDLDAIEKGLTHQTLIDRVLRVFGPDKLTIAVCTPKGKKLINPSTLCDGAYRCTSEGDFDIGSAIMNHHILERR